MSESVEDEEIILKLYAIYGFILDNNFTPEHKRLIIKKLDDVLAMSEYEQKIVRS